MKPPLTSLMRACRSLEFENNHYSQIRRHYQAITLERDEDPRQLDLFRKQSPFRACIRQPLLTGVLSTRDKSRA
jgi:hypothetical protein